MKLGRSFSGGESKQNKVDKNSDLSVWKIDFTIDQSFWENYFIWIPSSMEKLKLNFEI